MVIPAFSSAFGFFEKLADYYEQEGLNGKNHSRLQRYEILLDFIIQRFPEQEKKYRELLTIDLYLRERVKRRPAFAPDQIFWKEEIREIWRKVGKQKHVEVVTENTEEITWLIFDYEKRNPLTQDASVTLWRKETV